MKYDSWEQKRNRQTLLRRVNDLAHDELARRAKTNGYPLIARLHHAEDALWDWYKTRRVDTYTPHEILKDIWFYEDLEAMFLYHLGMGLVDDATIHTVVAALEEANMHAVKIEAQFDTDRAGLSTAVHHAVDSKLAAEHISFPLIVGEADSSRITLYLDWSDVAHAETIANILRSDEGCGKLGLQLVETQMLGSRSHHQLFRLGDVGNKFPFQ